MSDEQARPGVEVLLWHNVYDIDSWEVVARTTTSATGAYTLANVPVDTMDNYRVLWNDPERRIVNGGQRVVPVPGKTVTSTVDAQPGSTISGQVRYVNGALPTHAQVVIDADVAPQDDTTPGVDEQPFPFEVIPRSAEVESDGSFRITGLPRGKYRLTYTDSTHYFFDICHDGRRVRRDDRGFLGCSLTTPLALGIGMSRTVPQRTFMDRSAQIIGLVTDESGRPLDADVEVFSKGATKPTSIAVTKNGVWRAIDLPPAGDWQVRVEPWSSRFQPLWFRDAVLRRAAEIVTTTNGEKIIRRNVILPRS